MDEAKIKLDKELHNLSILKETMTKSQQLSNGMGSILTSFEDRLAKLEKTILPVYHETENLQRRQENIDATLKSLDFVIHYFAIAKKVEPVIQEGLNGNLDVFLKCMEDLQGGIEFFTKNRPNSDELDEISALYETGGNALQREFRALLSRSSKPVPAIVILDLVSADDEIAHDEEKIILQQLPEKVVKELIAIANWLRLNKNEDFTNVYAALRANILQRSIQSLREHQKSSSGSSTTMTMHSSPMLGGRKNLGRDTPSKKASKRIQQALMKKATAAIMRYSPSVESSALGHKLQSALMTEPKDEIMEQEIEAYLVCITALHKLMQSEFQLLEDIIPEDHQSVVFERLISPSVDGIVQEGDALISRVKKSVAKHDFSAALSLFPILRHLTSMKPEFELLLEGSTSNARARLQGLLVTTQITMNKALEEFIENIKNDQDTKMPKDGTVHELTSNVMILLEQLQDFVDMVGTVLCISDAANYKGTKNGQDLNRYSLAQYITRVLSALGLALQNKSETYNDGYLKAIFRLNNLYYILQSLQRTSLLKIVEDYSKDLDSYYSDEIREQKRVYSQSWSRVLHYIMEVDKPISQQRTAISTVQMKASFKLKDKDKQNIKDRFTGFNKEMEEVYKIQKSYAIPSIELRESLKRDNKEFILPKYQIFYDKYINTSFTKNPDKYLKYSPQQISELVDKFFDASA